MTQELLQFPCDFPLKVLGRTGPEFETAVVAIVRRHFPALSEAAITLRPSSGGKYTALTVVVRAESRAQMDSLYRELTACPHVAMAL